MVSVKYPTENKRLTLKVQMISVIKGKEVLTGKSVRQLRPSSVSRLWLEYVRTSGAEYPTVQAFSWSNYDSWKNKTNSISNINKTAKGETLRNKCTNCLNSPAELTCTLSF